LHSRYARIVTLTESRSEPAQPFQRTMLAPEDQEFTNPQQGDLLTLA
jgi:hypothetical protein